MVEIRFCGAVRGRGRRVRQLVAAITDTAEYMEKCGEQLKNAEYVECWVGKGLNG